MKLDSFKRKHILLIHISFWTIEIFIGYSFYIFSPSEIPVSYYIGRIFSTLIWMSAFYLAYFVLVPIASGKKNKFVKIGIILIIYLSFVIIHTYYIRYLNLNYYKTQVLPLGRYLLNASTYATSNMVMGLIFRLAIDGISALVKKSQLEKQNLKSELALLRSQINPHFLFNTLNNMHSFTHTDPDKTAFSIIKLSEIMRYMLNEANTEKVLLEDEIEYIKSYIALQNIRFSEKEYVKFEIEGNFKGISVAPMIFIPFVENAFKHGDKRQKEFGIQVLLHISKEEIKFEVINLKRKIKSQEIEGKSGFGLENLKRRLELAYPDKFNLNISDDGSKYITSLKIRL